MIKIEDVEVMGIRKAIKGMRNAMNSWDKSDSKQCDLRCVTSSYCNYSCPFENKLAGYTHIGEKDMELAKRLIKAGSPDRKFMRMIHVQADVTAPVYFMSELDTYKVGTVRNSSSFMHKGVSKAFEIEDFGVSEDIIKVLSSRINDEEKQEIYYPYETDEYKVYTTSNGREYEIFKNGRVYARPFSCTDCYGKGRTRTFERKECKPSLNSNSYWELNLGGREKEKWLLHRLVAYVWCDNPNGYETVDHLDGNKNNNSVENLEWVTREENIKRGFKNGLMRKDNLHANYLNWKYSSKVTPDIKIMIRKEYEDGKKQIDLAVKYKLSQPQISAIIRDCKNTSDNKKLFENCWYWENILKTLNELRDEYIETKDKNIFMAIRQILPMSYLYFSTIDLSYENLFNIYHQRKNHKLNEWRDFCSWVETLPYMKEFLGLEDNLKPIEETKLN